LPGSLARQSCPAVLPGSLSRQSCPAVLPGSLARQSCPAVLLSSLARQSCPAVLPGSHKNMRTKKAMKFFKKYLTLKNVLVLLHCSLIAS
jgi:hypothetical protein